MKVFKKVFDNFLQILVQKKLRVGTFQQGRSGSRKHTLRAKESKIKNRKNSHSEIFHAARDPVKVKNRRIFLLTFYGSSRDFIGTFMFFIKIMMYKSY